MANCKGPWGWSLDEVWPSAVLGPDLPQSQVGDLYNIISTRSLTWSQLILGTRFSVLAGGRREWARPLLSQGWASFLRQLPSSWLPSPGGLGASVQGRQKEKASFCLQPPACRVDPGQPTVQDSVKAGACVQGVNLQNRQEKVSTGGRCTPWTGRKY